ncbi:MAG: hypothetical protein IKQ40_01250 [Lachnospiraceae bacterium]|nr:hypothetical protein [Lachnospiraceae bacterium]
MNKKIVFGISVILNIILALVFVAAAAGAAEELKFNYVEDDTITPDNIRSNLERENYGVAAALSRPVRGGALVADGYTDYYMLGEYADLLFLKEIFTEAGNNDTARACEKRLDEIRDKMPDFGSLFDKIEWSAKRAIAE